MGIGVRRRRWSRLFLGMAGLVGFVGALHWVSPHLPGAAGRTYRHNVVADIETTALLYSEAGDVCDFLDTEKGKYANGFLPAAP